MLSLPNDPDRRPETEEAELHVIRSANRLHFCFERFPLEFQVRDDGMFRLEREISMHLLACADQNASIAFPGVCAINKLEQRHSTMRTALQ